MKILLIQSKLESEDIPIIPNGLCYISSILKNQGHEVNIYDPNVSKNDYTHELTEIINKNKCDMVGISLRNIDNNLMNKPIYYYSRLKPLLELIHQLLPDAKIMIGGAGFSIFAETIMKRHPLIDYGIYLEGYETVCELMENLDTPEKVKGIYYRKENDIFFNGKRERPDLNKLPAAPWQQIDIKKYLKYKFAVGIVSKTGCIFNCSYCTYPKLDGKKFSIRSPKLIVDEIETLTKDHGLKNFFFVDSMFNYPVDHASDVCKEIIKRNINVKWTAYFIEKYFTKDFMELALKAGCECFSFSPDGIHDSSMKALGKINSEKDLYKTYELIKNQEGAKGGYSFFINPPAQDFIGFCKLLSFYFKTRILNRKSFVACSVWYPRVYPHTALHKHAIKVSGFQKNPEDLLPVDPDRFLSLFWVNSSNNYINIFYKFVVTPKAILRNLIEKIRGFR
jgi:radical SAM superfamily enzyme YgiQ (UPF0313 family)